MHSRTQLRAQNVFPYGIFLTAEVDVIFLLFWVRVGFLRAFLVRTVDFFCSPFPLLRL